MSDSTSVNQANAIAAAHDAGRRLGLATAALALGVVSFINLLGVEKSILSIVLAVLAIRGMAPAGVVRFRTRFALVISSLQLVTTILALVLFRDEVGELLQLLYELN